MREKENRKVVWSDTAREDMAGIGSCLAQMESYSIADKVLTDVEEAGKRLAYQALLWRVRENVYPEARFVIVHSYVIVYIVEDAVTILRVVHGVRDIEAIFHTDDSPQL